MQDQLKIGFIGVGKYSGALAKAIIEKNNSTSNFSIYDSNPKATTDFEDKESVKIVDSAEWKVGVAYIINESELIFVGIPHLSNEFYCVSDHIDDLLSKLAESKKPLPILVYMDNLSFNRNFSKHKTSFFRIFFNLSVDRCKSLIALQSLKATNSDKEILETILKKVSFKEEVVHVENYLDLMKYRFFIGVGLALIYEFYQCGKLDEFDVFYKTILNSHIKDGNCQKIIESLKEGHSESFNSDNFISEGGATETFFTLLNKEVLHDLVKQNKTKPIKKSFNNSIKIFSEKILFWHFLDLHKYIKDKFYESINKKRLEIDNFIKEFMSLLEYFMVDFRPLFSWFNVIDISNKNIYFCPASQEEEVQGKVFDFWEKRDDYNKTMRTIYSILKDVNLPSMMFIISKDNKPSRWNILSENSLILSATKLIESSIIEPYKIREEMNSIDSSKIYDCLRDHLEKAKINHDIINDFREQIEKQLLYDKTLKDSDIEKQLKYFLWIEIAADDQYKHMVYIPASYGDSIPISVSIGLKEDVEPEIIWELKNLVINLFLPLLEHNYRIFSLSAAIAAIMGRNLSHNIGSHAIYYFSQELGPCGEEQTKKFLDYIRERMGFVGLISTTEPKWVSSSNLREVIQSFKNNSPLLKNIVKSEIGDKLYHIKIDKSCNDINIDFPHASYGHQALYVIFENIIRNAIKHNSTKANRKDYEIIFHVKCVKKDRDDNFYYVSVEDNFGVCNEVLLNNLKEKLKTEILNPDGTTNTSNLGMKEKRIAASFLQMGTSSMLYNPEKLPIKLYCSKDDDCESCNGGSKICAGDQKGNLAYEFKLLKPKKCLVVTDAEAINANKDILVANGMFPLTFEELNRNVSSTGADRIFLSHDFIIFDNREYDNEKHKTINEFIKKYSQRLPIRIGFAFDIKSSESSLPFCFVLGGNNKVLFIQQLEAIPEINKTNIERFHKGCWKAWTDKLANKRNHPMYIIDNRIDRCEIAKYIKDENPEFKNAIVFLHNLLGERKMKEAQSDSFYYDEFSGKINELTYFESEFALYESCLLKIAVADERIFKAKAKQVELKQGYKDELGKVWGKRRVKLIDHNTIINDLDFSQVVEYDPDIFIIHMGILDKCKETIKENSKDLNGEAIENLLVNIWKEKLDKMNSLKRIVIDSDRGEPENLAKYDGIWLHFSELSRLIVNNANNPMSKMELVRVITSLRGSNKGDE